MGNKHRPAGQPIEVAIDGSPIATACLGKPANLTKTGIGGATPFGAATLTATCLVNSTPTLSRLRLGRVRILDGASPARGGRRDADQVGGYGRVADWSRIAPSTKGSQRQRQSEFSKWLRRLFE